MKPTDRKQRATPVFRTCLIVVAWMGLSLSHDGNAEAHKGHTSTTPWKVCEEAALGDSCHWNNEAHDEYIGTCREVQRALICVRNQPILRGESTHTAHSKQSSLSFGVAIALALVAAIALGARAINDR